MFYTKQLSKNKYVELQIEKFKSSSFFDCFIKWTTKEDHAGFRFQFEILGLMIYFQIYDCRHWNDELDKWEEYLC